MVHPPPEGSPDRGPTWLGPAGIALIAAGLLADVRLVESLVADGGVLYTPLFRHLVLAGQIALVLAGAALLAFRGVRHALAAGVLVAAALVVYVTLAIPSPQRVLDCAAGEGRCFQRPIHHFVGTPECWHGTPEACSPLREGIESIVYRTDPTNYVEGPFTSTPPTVEHLEVELDTPWDLAFLPDGELLVTERGGRVIRVGSEGPRTLLELEPLVSWGAGLLGIAVDPDFRENRAVYLHYWWGYDRSDPAFAELDPWLARILGRVSRFVLEGDSLVREEVILDSIPGSPMHAGGRLEVGPDGKLFLTTGDAHAEELAQDPGSLAGKILRFNPDGSVPDDNPFPGSHVWALGLRNPQGLTWHPATGELYQAGHGSDRLDEVNRVSPGANLGWPWFSCDGRTGWPDPVPEGVEFHPPVKCFDLYTMAPSGIAFVTDPESPWFGDLFVAGLRGKHLRRLRVEGGQLLSEEIFFVAEGGGAGADLGNHHRQISHRLRPVAHRDGALYLLGDEFGLVRLTPGHSPRPNP